MPKQIIMGAKVRVSVVLEFKGTVWNHMIAVEGQHIPTINNRADNFEILLNGDPLQIYGRFLGSKGSEIKKFEVKVNENTVFTISDIKFKYNEIVIEFPVPFAKFNLAPDA